MKRRTVSLRVLSASAAACALVILLATLGVFGVEGGSPADETDPLPLRRAHAHNDYHHPRPLLDALENGFQSVEADVFLVGGELLVGHDRSELRPGRTLQALYLDPLRERVRRNGGRVLRGGGEFLLLVDIKSEAVSTYEALARVLARYRDMLVWVEGSTVHSGAVRVVVSGNRAWERIAADSPRYVGIDGRLRDLDAPHPAHLVPLVSDNWRLHFRWRGEGPMPPGERARLREIVRKCHAKGRRVRFWATPENPKLWGELLDAGVDLINTDDLAGLRRFLLERAGKRRRL